MSETAFPGAAELTKECEAYLDAFTGNPVYYPVIMMLFLSNVLGRCAREVSRQQQRPLVVG